MTPTNRKRRERQLTRDGFVSVRSIGGYVPAAFAEEIRERVAACQAEVDAAAAKPARPRGRPPKALATEGKE